MRTTTDNGRNFMKAFTVFGVNYYTDISNNEADDVEFFDIFDILSTSNTNMNDDDNTNIHLPPHFRWANHTLDLVVSKDIETYFNDTKQINKLDKHFIQLKKLYRKVLEKCKVQRIKNCISSGIKELISFVIRFYLQRVNTILYLVGY